MITDKVKLGPVIFPVVEYDELSDGDIQLHGQINWVDFEIKISKHNPLFYRFVTLWHECLHGLSDIYGIRLSERQIEAMATGIVQMLQDNPDLRIPPTQDDLPIARVKAETSQENG